MAAFMTGVEKARAKAIGVDKYFRGKRFRTLKDEHIYAVLDKGVESMRVAGCPEPIGKTLGALATTLVQSDEKSIGDLVNRGVAAVVDGTPDDWTEFFELLGFEIAERYLDLRKGTFSREMPITAPDSLVEKLEGVLEEMQAFGKQMSAISSGLPDEMAVKPAEDMPDALNVGRAVLEGVATSCELLVPPVDEDGELPNNVERTATAKAAFLRLAVDDLRELANKDELTDLPNKAALAKALAEKYADDLDQVAKLTFRESATEASFGLVTRLMPLSAVPDLEVAHAGFSSLTGRFFEIRPTVFFVFRSVTLSPDKRFLTIGGSIRSFFVSPVEFVDDKRLNPRPRKDDVVIKLEASQKWAMVESARASDMIHVGAILRRSGKVSTAPAVPPPDAMKVVPYGSWDARSLWMLDLMRRDMQAPELRLQETLMANFDTPKGTDPDEEDGDDEKVKPRLASVRLKGRALQDHPEVCQRIVDRAHMKDLEFRIRKVTDKEKGTATIQPARLAWEPDHLVVMTGAAGEIIDSDLHATLVRLVRDAVARPLSDELIPILQKVQKRSQEKDVGADAEPVLDDQSAASPQAA
jgi:hypothetical protein